MAAVVSQAKWANAIVEIGKAHQAGEDYKELTTKYLNELYDFSEPLLFKPTLASKAQFRGTFEDALSYFVGGGLQEDNGFAIKPWTKVRFENFEIRIEGACGFAMGNYFFTDLSGAETKVEYSFGYRPSSNGDLKIFLHHSSLPYQP